MTEEPKDTEIFRLKKYIESLEEDNKWCYNMINKLQNHNWKVAMKNANYPMMEVVDENTVKIEGVEYKKVKTQKPQTLKDIIWEWIVIYNIRTDSLKDHITNDLVERIENWMSQYKCDYVVCVEYLQGYNALMEILKENLK